MLNTILYGSDEIFKIKNEIAGTSYSAPFQGIISFIESQDADQSSTAIKKWIEGFMEHRTCPSCNGQRLKKESLHFKIDGKNISEVANMDIVSLNVWMNHIEGVLSDRKKAIGFEVLREIKTRLSFLLDVGIDYLSLNRQASSLSGGESQRIRLATQIGSQLVNVLYILDEPSIGLHQRDNHRLIESPKNTQRCRQFNHCGGTR